MILPGSSETNMKSEKLDRMENMSWLPPKLQFDIERDGGMQYGSKRSRVYTWTIDVERRQLFIVQTRIRQKIPRAAPLDCAPMVERVLNAVRAGRVSNQSCEAVKMDSGR